MTRDPPLVHVSSLATILFPSGPRIKQLLPGPMLKQNIAVLLSLLQKYYGYNLLLKSSTLIMPNIVTIKARLR